MKYRLIKEYPGSCDLNDLVKKTIDGHYIQCCYPFKSFHKNIVENNPEFWQEVKESLFTTEDGVDIYQGDEYWFIDTGLELAECNILKNTAHKRLGMDKDNLYFSTEQKALEYIEQNKPIYSEKYVKDFLNTFDSFDKLTTFYLWKQYKLNNRPSLD